MANVKATMTLREMERKLKLSRTSLRNYRDRAEASGRSMVELLALNDAELQAIMLKGVTGNQEYIKIGNEATSKIATIVHQKR